MSSQGRLASPRHTAMAAGDKGWDRPASDSGSAVEAPRPNLRRILVALDVMAMGASWLGVSSLFAGGNGYRWGRQAWQLSTVMVVGIALVAMQRLYQARVSSVRSVELVRLSRVAVGTAVVAYVVDLDPRGQRREAVVGALACFVVMAILRRAYGKWLRAAREQGRWLRRVVAVGDDPEILDTAALLDRHPEFGYQVAGLVVSDPGRGAATRSGIPVLGATVDLLGLVGEAGATGVVTSAAGLPAGGRSQLLRDLMAAGIHIQLATGLSGISHRRLRALPLAHQPFLYLEPLSLGRPQQVAKRTLDLALLPLVLLASAPVLLICGLAVWLEDRGPILFRQKRVGRDGLPFTIFKLRTMVVDAEDRLGEILDLNERRGPLFKLHHDPRTTRVGRFLRATSIDELPQLWNVLIGKMSLVGPRPALPSEVAQFDDELLLRHQVTPGLTGLWQTEARDDPSFESYRLFDIFYVDNWSMSLDLAILFGTFTALVGRAARLGIAASRRGHEPAAPGGAVRGVALPSGPTPPTLAGRTPCLEGDLVEVAAAV